MPAPWLRLDAVFFQHPQNIAAGWHGKIVYLAALTMSKQFGWEGSAKHFTPEAISSHLGVTGVSHGDIRDGIDALMGVGLLVHVDGDEYLIPGWATHQHDRTAADRQRAKRERDKAKSHGDGRDATDVTGTVSRTSRHVRSGPPGTENPPSAPPGTGGALPASPSPEPGARRLRRRERAAVGIILDKLAQGAVTVGLQQLALKDRVLYRAGKLPEATMVRLYDRYHTQFEASIAKDRDLRREARSEPPSVFEERAQAETVERKAASQ